MNIVLILLPLVATALTLYATKKIRKIFKKEKEILHLLGNVNPGLTDPNGFGGLDMKLDGLNIPSKYRKIFYEMTDGDICIDCGANKGKFINACRHNDATVFAFEPNPVLANALARFNRDSDKVHVINAAVGAVSGTADFINDPDNFGDEGGNIVGAYSERKTNKQSVEVIDLADFLDKNIIKKDKKIYLLKIDIEGAEFDLIPGLVKNKIHEHARYIVCETHARFFPDGTAKLEKLKDLIAKSGITNIDLGWV
ncbi:MAG: FkbM family methyltransferase [Proteobacteria bacterium]|nr:FkbM family methyltransferase [Pseudomonadota bacterium]